MSCRKTLRETSDNALFKQAKLHLWVVAISQCGTNNILFWLSYSCQIGINSEF